jgi:hypothetical protein
VNERLGGAPVVVIHQPSSDLKGALEGLQLKPLILIPEFWFAWSQFRPGTRLFTAHK